MSTLRHTERPLPRQELQPGSSPSTSKRAIEESHVDAAISDLGFDESVTTPDKHETTKIERESSAGLRHQDQGDSGRGRESTEGNGKGKEKEKEKKVK